MSELYYRLKINNLGNCPGRGGGPTPVEPMPPLRNGSISIPPLVLKNRDNFKKCRYCVTMGKVQIIWERAAKVNLPRVAREPVTISISKWSNWGCPKETNITQI